ncbi:cingulin [Neosynchiropus ocellatus]
MAAPSSGQKTPVDHGVQIRFINDLSDTSGAKPWSQPKTKAKSKTHSNSKYGVAVRVQGIAGLPYVVLKDGQKGDSYGVQLRTHNPPGYNSLPRRREKAEPGTQGIDYGAAQGGTLRRAQSHGSLLDHEGEGGDEEFQLSRPPGDGKSGSYGNLDGGIGVREDRGARNDWDGSYRPNGSLASARSYESLSDLHPPQRHTPVNRLINRFDGGSQPREPSPGNLESTSPSPHRFTSPPSSTHSSLGRSQNSVSSHSINSPGRYAAAETTEAKVTPDLLLDQGPTGETSSEEEQMIQTIYSVLREGNSESDAVIKHRVKVIIQRIQKLKQKEDSPTGWLREKRELERKVSELQVALQNERRAPGGGSDPVLKAELESSLDENVRLQEILDRKKKELNETQSDLTQLRMDRENAEVRVRQLEDQLAELQEELRRESGSKTDLMSLQTHLMEVCQLKQKQEETLRQRERELTALKGALKEEVASHDKELEVLREQYKVDMEKLRGSMEQVSQSHAGIEAERLRVNASVRTLQQQLEDCRDESSHWMEQFHSTRDELRKTKQELLQTRLEKEETEEELKEMQEKVSAMKQQIPDPSLSQTANQELQRSSVDLQKTRLDLEKQRTEFDKKVMEIIALKKAHQNQEAELKYEIDRLKEQLQRVKDDFAKAQEKNKKLPDPTVISELELKLRDASSEAGQLKEKLVKAEEELSASKSRLSRSQLDIKSLEDDQQEQMEVNARLKEKLSRLEAQLQTSATESSELELALHSEVRGVRNELDELKRKDSKLKQEHRELSLRFEDSEKERENLRQRILKMEELKQQQELTITKLSKDYESLTASSQEEARALKAHLEEQRDKARKEIQEAQRLGSEAQTQLDRNHFNSKRLEEEMSRHKKELLLVCEERDNHQLDKELLSNRLRHLEAEMETVRNGQNDKSREIRILEDKLKRMALELEEEKSSVEMMTDRVNRSRDQIDQLRSELMQERSSKQDLELDKSSMERQLKDLRSRVSDMEGQSRSSTGVSQLESKIQELEESLRSEEREKNSLLGSQRRTERKLKELNIMLDEERQTHIEQRDQLALRVKALKRQVDEGETELERIEALRRKAQRDMEEQLELKEALQGRVTALETELKRKTQVSMRQTLDSSALSSDDDSLYDPATITSILTESNLQASSC